MDHFNVEIRSPITTSSDSGAVAGTLRRQYSLKVKRLIRAMGKQKQAQKGALSNGAQQRRLRASTRCLDILVSAPERHAAHPPHFTGPYVRSSALVVVPAPNQTASTSSRNLVKDRYRRGFLTIPSAALMPVAVRETIFPVSRTSPRSANCSSAACT